MFHDYIGGYLPQKDDEGIFQKIDLLWLMLISRPRPKTFFFFITTVNCPREFQLLLVRDNLSKNVERCGSVCLRMCGCSYTCLSVKLSNLEHDGLLSYVLCDSCLAES